MNAGDGAPGKDDAGQTFEEGLEPWLSAWLAVGQEDHLARKAQASRSGPGSVRNEMPAR
ncbi:hypothetical protein SAMN05216533_0633 [Streptomyces sp. Ag109_O5-10]|nr:hypothetical protein SAMN05216533_0633 [Streptomyces sp. Ag109_O5-10]